MQGCRDTSLPIYERCDENGINDENGIVVIVNGITYKMFPELKWNVEPGEVIGYAGNWRTTVSNIVGDTENNFIYLCDVGSSMYYSPLYRTDKEIPEPTANSIDKIVYSESYNSNEPTMNTIIDNETIQSLFEILETGTRFSEITFLKNINISIACYSEAVPGASYYLYVVNCNGKLVCGNRKEGYVEIPEDLLKKIAGYNINVGDLLAQ